MGSRSRRAREGGEARRRRARRRKGRHPGRKPPRNADKPRGAAYASWGMVIRASDPPIIARAAPLPPMRAWAARAVVTCRAMRNLGWLALGAGLAMVACGGDGAAA